jgi:dTDP-4-dehydrorhamnose reductase
MADLELWGGVECTINRVGDVWYDQLAANGHRDRLSDLELFASLGIRRLRQAVLWEQHSSDPIDWRHADCALSALQRLGVAPIVGLLHHGSGPRGTSLVQEGFAAGLAAHAARVAARYPWVEEYTPVNEPLTTARFSGLYGLWYPHGRDDATFARALVNQCRATVLAMRAIRAVNPRARLVQTEDLGYVRSTAALAYQAGFENQRRWLTWDLLCGRVDVRDPIMQYLLGAGIPAAELRWFAENPCPPAILGINHYVTSDRFLDHRLDRYPDVVAGGNGRHSYVDVEAVRALPQGDDGWSRCLDETWQRYGIPMAITEAHLCCTREEQLRWFRAAWTAATTARVNNQDVRAVTAWALLGSRDWNSLLTRHNGHYEPGVFDIRGGRPRATALARAMKALSLGQDGPCHPSAEGPGWWTRPGRLLYDRNSSPPSVPASPRSRRQPLVIAGAGGNLGQALGRICEQRGLEYLLLKRADLDICCDVKVATMLDALRPWAVINAAGYVRVDEAERERARCLRENYSGPAQLALACAARGVRLLTFSSDLVFDGLSASPYVEGSAVAPLNTYGESKALAEQAVLQGNPEALVIRTSSFFGPWHASDFLPSALRALNCRQRFEAIDDVVVSHTYVPDLADACIDLLIDGERGLWHLANQGPLTWLELARLGAELAGIDTSGLVGKPCKDFGLPARRPAFSVLATERGLTLPSLDDALHRYFRHRRQLGIAA